MTEEPTKQQRWVVSVRLTEVAREQIRFYPSDTIERFVKMQLELADLRDCGLTIERVDARVV